MLRQCELHAVIIRVHEHESEIIAPMLREIREVIGVQSTPSEGLNLNQNAVALDHRFELHDGRIDKVEAVGVKGIINVGR